ncbi:MAG: molybdenum cofactor guanylyltransferase [Candidatus Marinimicrobia bacterium]|nr:molybdenum cofactor guanylyltransferase [Candidatus Neomarinimicrobiota bacterium]MCF7850099.1 molybdenum cofactor guanylyltransferase [Candidatus Neomarinimicrobiota bacterium]
MNQEFTFKNCTAIILAGGKAERMGLDKRFLTIGSENLLERQVRIWKKHFPHVIISANDPSNLAALGVPVIQDKTEGSGPLEGLASALASSPTHGNFVIAVDIPEVRIDLIGKMWKQLDHTSAVVPRYEDGNQEPLHAFYDKSCVPVFRDAIEQGERAIHKVLIKCSVYHYPMIDEQPIRNLNDPADYAAFMRERDSLLKK